MHAVVRMYSGAGGKKLFDVLEERKGEVEALIRPVKGFVSYSLIRTADGGTSVTEELAHRFGSGPIEGNIRAHIFTAIRP